MILQLYRKKEELNAKTLSITRANLRLTFWIIIKSVFKWNRAAFKITSPFSGVTHRSISSSGKGCHPDFVRWWVALNRNICFMGIWWDRFCVECSCIASAIKDLVSTGVTVPLVKRNWPPRNIEESGIVKVGLCPFYTGTFWWNYNEQDTLEVLTRGCLEIR